MATTPTLTEADLAMLMGEAVKRVEHIEEGDEESQRIEIGTLQYTLFLKGHRDLFKSLKELRALYMFESLKEDEKNLRQRCQSLESFINFVESSPERWESEPNFVNKIMADQFREVILNLGDRLGDSLKQRALALADKVCPSVVMNEEIL